jgi:hypothetical protein
MLVVGRILRRIVALANRVSKLALGFNAHEEMLKEMVITPLDVTPHKRH